jgi:hypothetical protein
MAPRLDVHAEGDADRRHPPADLAEAEQSERATVQIGAHRALPRAAGTQRRALLDHVTRQPEQSATVVATFWKSSRMAQRSGMSVAFSGVW